MKSDLLSRYPRVLQRSNWDCGRAVAQSILLYFGHDPKQAKKSLATSILDGTHPGGLGAFLREQGLDVIVGNGFTIDDLRWQTRKGRPVACLVQRADEDGFRCGHWVTVLAVARRRVHFHDPADGDGSEAEADFLNRWWDNDSDAHQFRRRGIAVHS